jgi:TonB family protein
MDLWEFLRQWPRRRLLAGVVASLLIHALLTWAVVWGLRGGLLPRWVPKRGDTIIVELPRPEEPATAGSRAAPPPPAPPAAAPSPAPPPPSAAAPPTRPPAPARPASPPREAPAPPREERRVAIVPRSPAPALPTSPEPTPRAAEPPAPAAEPAPRAEPPAALAAPSAEAPRPAPAERQQAAVPPRPATPSASDVRAALRRGSGGQGQGRGGIEGDPMPLDSQDERYSEYLEQVRRRIKEKWGFPCVRTARGCDHYTTSLDVHFGILKDGRVQFVDVVKASDHAIYDEYAVNAIRLAQPFPPVPPAMMSAMKAGSTGLAISARFSYVVESSLTNLLR